MPDNQAGSCEPCKKKKCKCDRRRPHCSQCNFQPLLCEYSKNNKRGIPGGYLSALEQRLNDTEAALHHAVTELHKEKGSFGSTSISRNARLDMNRPSKTTKSSRLAEWAKYPLKDSADAEQWWIGLREKDCAVNDASGSRNSHSETPSFRETNPEYQEIAFDNIDDLLHSGVNHDNISMTPQGPDTTTQGASAVNRAYLVSLTAAARENGLDNRRLALSYGDSTPTSGNNQEAINVNDFGVQIHDTGINSESDPVRHQTEKWQYSHVSSSTSQDTRVETEEDFVLSKHLSNSMQDMYY